MNQDAYSNKHKKLILASASKRRLDLLKNAGYDFDVMISGADESAVFKENLEPGELVVKLARLKAVSAAEKAPPESLILAADTIVVKNNQILGKPKDKSDAFLMLKSLGGNIHQVYTGVSIHNKEDKSHLDFFEVASVHMSNLSDDEISAYIKTGQPMDKAGSYGIQGIGGLFVSCIEGDFFAIEGLPIHRVYQALKKLGILPEFKDTEYL